MKRLAIISLIMCAFNTNVSAQNIFVNPFPKVTFGVEWSYLGTAPYKTHFNFFSDDGYRRNINERHTRYFNNAEVLLHVGYNFNSHWNLSFYSGLTGMADIHNAVPLSLRATYAFGNDPLKDRWFTFMDLGTGFSIKKEPQEIYTGKFGGGYRISLSRNTKLDFIAAFRLAYTHPDIVFDDSYIALEWINSNEALLGSLCLGMALTF